MLEIVKSLNQEVEELLYKAQRVPAEKLGLDYRCGHLYVLDDGLAVRRETLPNLLYYGGFEYIDSTYRVDLPRVVFFSAEADRVQDALEFFHDPKA